MTSTVEETSLWQTPEWEAFQKKLGHQVQRISVAGQELAVLIYPLFLGKKYGYIARPKNFSTALNANEVAKLAQKENLIFLRVDPEESIQTARTSVVQPSSSPQPETTLILDLQLSEQELLAQMKRKGRYNIALAEKKAVEVKRASSPEERQAFAKIFYQLLQQTTDRDGFTGHDDKYYQTMLECLPMSEIYIAFFDGKPLAGAICTFQKRRAIYYYGASGNEHRELMAPYLVQWEAIREAKRRGCTSYDFLGIAPEDASSDHPWKGISEFKRKFGGTVVSYPRPVDIVFQPFWYKIYRLLKWIQKRGRK